MVELYLGGNVVALAGLTVVATTVATSVLTTRAPGMRLHRAPLFSWAALVGSIALVLVLPVAVGSNIVQFVDYRYGGAAFGGSSGIWPWTSYLYTGPVLGITAVFVAGFVADVVAVTFRTRFPHRAIALIGIGLIGTAAFAGIGQQDVITLPGTGSEVRLENFATKLGFLAVWALFTLLPVLGVAIVMGIGALTAKPTKPARRPNFNAPILFGFFGLGLAAVGIARRSDHRDRGLRPRGDGVRGRSGSRHGLRSRARWVRGGRLLASPRRRAVACRNSSSSAWRCSERWAGRWLRCPT